MDELTRQMARKTQVSVESLTAELDAVRDRAMAVDQVGAAHAAIVSKAKLHGLMVDRKEVGAAGDFAALQTTAEVLALVREQLGEHVAALIGAAISQQVEVEALPEPTPEPDESPKQDST